LWNKAEAKAKAEGGKNKEELNKYGKFILGHDYCN